MKKALLKIIFIGLCCIPLMFFLNWGLQYITGLTSADPSQPLFNELYKADYQHFRCGNRTEEMSKIAKKYIPLGTTAQQVLETLDRNGFTISADNTADGKIVPNSQVQGTRGKDRWFYVQADLNNGRVKEVRSWAACIGL